MSILDKTVKRIREFNDNRRTKLAASLLEKTIEAERKFLREAKRFGIEPNNINFRNYYEILGIKYTNDQKAIRQAYIELIKRYHPDVNKGAMATQITKDVNEAYGVLKDEKKKADYDSKFSKGENRMGPEVISALYNELMNKYNQLRNKDFDEFNKRVATPQYRDAIKAAVEDVIDWNKRLAKASDMAFGDMRKYGKWLKRLEKSSKDLARKVGDDERRIRLSENISRLDGLVQSYTEINKGIDSVIARVRDDIFTQETNMADQLKRQLY